MKSVTSHLEDCAARFSHISRFKVGVLLLGLDLAYIIHSLKSRQSQISKVTHHEEKTKRAILSAAMPEPKTN